VPTEQSYKNCLQELSEKDRIAEKRRANRIEIVRMEASGNETILERLSETYRTLELNSNAHNLDQVSVS
jgi:hypothetical protein